MNPDDMIPSPRDARLDAQARHISELCEQRIQEHGRMRRLHRTGADGLCVEDGQVAPCRSMQLIDATVVKA